jgi:hypothetical protein
VSRDTSEFVAALVAVFAPCTGLHTADSGQAGFLNESAQADVLGLIKAEALGFPARDHRV